ncbi:small RNA 2'-O-methyltransferase isoform X2 [Erpetoichthys calabaricus]|uniref:small RNA 2'-O-methyltransferase isoform X2 n=1 Tax=Erpetoichthys calabaricus TaxID=27687 RepID=UPI0022344178|nr:small RNA 2'-O-methyltransferase isoform X2 [Erpetoichthys calabaricus]
MERIKFSPPLYKQRYYFVIDLIMKSQPKKVVDLGCADCSLLRKMKFQQCVEELVGIDINQQVIRENMYLLSPLPCDYLNPRIRPLIIKLYQGSIIEKDPCVKNFDMASCIEVALDICVRYEYSVTFAGVGSGPAGTEDVGFCTQIAIFTRMPARNDRWPNSNADCDDIHSYKLLHEVKYPSYCDKNIFENALINEMTYWTEKIKKHFLNSTEQGDTKNNVQQDQESNEDVSWCSRSMEKHCVNWSVCKSADGYLEVQKHGDTIHIPLDQLFTILEVKKICSSVVRLKEALLEIEQFEIAGDNLVVCICDNEK